MARFPVLTTVGYLLRGVAILCAIGGVIALIGVHKNGIVPFVGLEIAGLTLWVYAEVTGVVLSIEANTFDSKRALEILVRATERGIVAAPASTPSTASISTPSAGGSPRTVDPANFAPAMPASAIQSGQAPSLLLNKIAIRGTRQSANSTGAILACDNNPQSMWETTEPNPDSAYAMFDLNPTRHISEISWTFGEACEGAILSIQSSMLGSDWKTIATPGDAPADVRQSLRCDIRARYVRFSFENPNKLPSLGHLREVQFFG